MNGREWTLGDDNQQLTAEGGRWKAEERTKVTTKQSSEGRNAATLQQRTTTNDNDGDDDGDDDDDDDDKSRIPNIHSLTHRHS